MTRHNKSNDLAHNPFDIVSMNALPALYKATAIHWAAAARVPVDNVLKWVDDHTTIGDNTFGYGRHVECDLGEMVKAFPVELPRNDAGLIDLTNHRNNPDWLDDMNRALIHGQLAVVTNDIAWGGGDDAWFDYIPDGLAVLTALQSEFWNTPFTFVFNNMNLYHADWPEDQEGTFEDAKARHEADFYIMDTVTPMLYALADEHAEDDLTIRVIEPRA